jgi:Lon protease-like protein
MDPSRIVIPIFPLNLVLFPQMPLPLHIFEDRYKLMINECLDSKTVFGIVLMDGDHLNPIGCTARILRVLKRYPDGRMDILTKGENRFQVEELINDKAYLEATITIFDDEIEPIGPEWRGFAEKGINLLERLAQASSMPESSSAYQDLDMKNLSFLFSDHAGFTLSEKQRFLEMTSTFERLQKSTRGLEKILDRFRITEEIEKIIGGNGKIPKTLRDKLKG